MLFFFVAEATTFREWVHYRYGTYSEVGFESDPLYPGYYQSGPLEKASVGCHNLTLEGATVAQAAAFSRDQESQTQQMVDASILRNKVRNWYLEIETTLTLSKSTVRHQWCHESEAYQTFTLWSEGLFKINVCTVQIF